MTCDTKVPVGSWPDGVDIRITQLMLAHASIQQTQQLLERKRIRRSGHGWKELERQRPTASTGVRKPRGLERELVRDRDREYSLRGSESRALSIVGSFRVVSSRDLRDHDNRHFSGGTC